MQLPEFDRRMQAMFKNARGRWTEILKACGLSEEMLNGRNQPCPILGCGGTDRFSYTDKFDEGNYICRKCGAGGGFKLLMEVKGLRGAEALRTIERVLGTAGPSPLPARPAGSSRSMVTLVARLWSEARPIVKGDAVDLYLCNRGLGMDGYPPSLRCHPALGYYEHVTKGKPAQLVAAFHAMLAQVQVGASDEVVTLHRTYLLNGRQAPVPDPKKMLSAGYEGGAVRLGTVGKKMGVSEGIENGLAVLKRHGEGVWAGLNASNLEHLNLPDQVEELKIYGDNDADSDYTGQVAAYLLARRFCRSSSKDRPRRAEVFIPKTPGGDWANVAYLKNVIPKAA